MVTYGPKVGKVCPRMPIHVHATFVYSFTQDLKALTSTLAVRYTFGFPMAFLWPFCCFFGRPLEDIGPSSVFEHNPLTIEINQQIYDYIKSENVYFFQLMLI